MKYLSSVMKMAEKLYLKGIDVTFVIIQCCCTTFNLSLNKINIKNARTLTSVFYMGSDFPKKGKVLINLQL